MKRIALTTALLSMTISCAMAEQPVNNSENNESTDYAQFFEDSERGWFWYEQLPKEVKEELLKKALEQQAQSSNKAEEEPLSQAWFRKNFQHYMDVAQTHPYDKEAMRVYLYLEKFMRDRAEIFAYEREKAITADPFLDESSRRSTASFGMKAMNIDANKNRQALLTQMGEKAGIYYFFAGDDSYSEKQTILVKLLEHRYGFHIVPVRIYGEVPESFPWDNILTNQGQAESMGVRKIPSIYLYNQENNSTEMVTQGLYPMDEIEKRLVYAGERISLITKEEASLVRPKDLYLDLEGRAGALGLPANAPKEFINLYTESLGQ